MARRARPIDIHPATAADADAIVRMMAALSEHEGDPADRFTRDRVLDDVFRDPPWLMAHIARSGSECCGAALWQLSYEPSQAARGALVASLWVDPPFRRLGIASRLVAAIAAVAAARGATYLWWTSNPGNSKAHAVYESWGAKSEPVVAHALVGERFDAMLERNAK